MGTRCPGLQRQQRSGIRSWRQRRLKLGEGGGLPSRDFSTESELQCGRSVGAPSVSRAPLRWLAYPPSAQGPSRQQTSQEPEWSAFWKGCRESPLTFLQHAQRLIGNGKTAALRAAGPEGEPASEPAPSFLLTQGQTPDASALGGPTSAPQVQPNFGKVLC